MRNLAGQATSSWAAETGTKPGSPQPLKSNGVGSLGTSIYSNRRILAQSPADGHDLYVAITRAAHRLTVVHEGDLPVPLHRLAS